MPLDVRKSFAVVLSALSACGTLSASGPDGGRGPKWVAVEASHGTMRGPDGKLFHVRFFRPPSNFVLKDDVTVRFHGKESTAHLLTPSDGGGVRWTYAFVVPGYGKHEQFVEKAELLTPKEAKVVAINCHADCPCPKCDTRGFRTTVCTKCDECDGRLVPEEEYPGAFAPYRMCRKGSH